MRKNALNKIYLSNTIYPASVPGLPNPPSDVSTLGVLIWDLDGNLVAPVTDRWVKLNYDLNAGSGSGDMRLFVPNSLFTGGFQYVYLYSQFGGEGGAFVNNDGYEEWAVRTGLTCEQTNTCEPPPQIPEPSSLLLLGSGLLGALGFGVSRKRR